MPPLRRPLTIASAASALSSMISNRSTMSFPNCMRGPPGPVLWHEACYGVHARKVYSGPDSAAPAAVRGRDHSGRLPGSPATSRTSAAPGSRSSRAASSMHAAGAHGGRRPRNGPRLDPVELVQVVGQHPGGESRARQLRQRIDRSSLTPRSSTAWLSTVAPAARRRPSRVDRIVDLVAVVGVDTTATGQGRAPSQASRAASTRSGSTTGSRVWMRSGARARSPRSASVRSASFARWTATAGRRRTGSPRSIDGSAATSVQRHRASPPAAATRRRRGSGGGSSSGSAPRSCRWRPAGRGRGTCGSRRGSGAGGIADRIGREAGHRPQLLVQRQHLAQQRVVGSPGASGRRSRVARAAGSLRADHGAGSATRSSRAEQAQQLAGSRTASRGRPAASRSAASVWGLRVSCRRNRRQRGCGRRQARPTFYRPTPTGRPAIRPHPHNRPQVQEFQRMASYGMNDVKNGMKILVNGDPCIITDTEYVKPGKGQAFTRVKYRNIKTGRVVELTMKATDTSRPPTSSIPTCSSCTPTASTGTSCSRRPSSRSRPTRPRWATPAVAQGRGGLRGHAVERQPDRGDSRRTSSSCRSSRPTRACAAIPRAAAASRPSWKPARWSGAAVRGPGRGDQGRHPLRRVRQPGEVTTRMAAAAGATAVESPPRSLRPADRSRLGGAGEPHGVVLADHAVAVRDGAIVDRAAARRGPRRFAPPTPSRAPMPC
jgi:hypothetical protein